MPILKKNRYFFLKFFLILSILSSEKIKANDCGWFFDNLTSPICTDASYIFYTGMLLTGGIYLTKESSSYAVQQQAKDKNHLKRWGEVGGDIGFGYLNGAYVLLNSLSGGESGSKNAEHMMESSLYTLGVTLALKANISESRPEYPDDKTSFPSGHSSFAFAFASVITARHGFLWGIPAHLIASYIAFSRINDGWHYLHDVVAGMTIGMSYGWGVYLNHEKYNKPYWFALVPIPDHGVMLSFRGEF